MNYHTFQWLNEPGTLEQSVVSRFFFFYSVPFIYQVEGVHRHNMTDVFSSLVAVVAFWIKIKELVFSFPFTCLLSNAYYCSSENWKNLFAFKKMNESTYMRPLSFFLWRKGRFRWKWVHITSMFGLIWISFSFVEFKIKFRLCSMHESYVDHDIIG